MRTLAIDFGQRRVGLALSDPTGFLAQALQVIERQSDGQVAADIAVICRDREVEEIVLGHPRLLSGEVGMRAKQVEKFAQLLKRHVDLPIRLFDERLTTVSAERVLIEADMKRKKRKQVIDAVAATILLQTYLDAQSH
ncbi:Holliday junction resolvase RuvX [Alicyclobacillus fodiniaquatilis]|jgi:putative Holliday junction resolvase|uniref:Putative pre-16S rRNA nuclease n=1 Tax=Alicyclobacillus fodiniaquatilis TaxID=1661150 RepID=A0ABW4JNR0_9BACL